MTRDILAARLAAAWSAPAAVVLPSMEAIRDALLNVSGMCYYERAADAVLNLLAASLPVWQPVEPGTVIKAGTLHRIEWAARPGLRSGEYVLSYDALASEGVRTLVDPRTVPAEPVDPDAAAVEAMADEAWRVIGEFPGLDITFQAGTDDDRDLCELIARAALTAYRAHIDKEA